MKIEYHTLYFPGTNQRIVDSQKEVMKQFDIPVNYTEQRIDHGIWMSAILEKAKSDLICFFDVDCVPLSKYDHMFYINNVKRTKTFCGIAQVSNHIPPAKHIYAAPAFFVIHKECWENMNASMVAGSNGNQVGDVCELFNYEAEEKGVEGWKIFPTHYYKPPTEGLWKLADKGFYGIGTIFGNSIYHLYQSRMSDNVDLFVRHCRNIIEGKLDMTEFHDATNGNYIMRL